MTRHAVVCVATYRRPVGLSRLLTSLDAMTVPDGWRVSVVVVDNDDEGSARPVIDELDPALDLHLAIEPRQGIPYARNRTVEMAVDLGADVVVFVDDDEWVERDWLAELIDASARHRAPIVMGAIIAEFDEPPPDWATGTDAFQRRLHEDGAELDFAITANALLDASLLTSKRPFDETLRYTGGEDLELFQRLHRAGHRIAYARRAVTHESIPASRVTTSWVLKRQYRRGTNRSAVLRRHDLRAATVVKRIAGGLVAIGSGAATWILGIATGATARLRGRMQMAYGVGLLVGLTGRQYDEYRVTHGG